MMELLWVMNIFIILTVVMTLQVSRLIKTSDHTLYIQLYLYYFNKIDLKKLTCIFR